MRRFTKKLAVAVLAVIGGYWAARVATPLVNPEAEGPQIPKAAPVTTESSGPAGDSRPSTASGDGNALILEVLGRLEHRPNIMAKVRQSMRVGRDRFTGEGAYWQQNVGNLRKSRWELKTLIGEDEAFVTQIFDGDYVWTDRRLPGQRNVSRINISRVRRELALNSPQLLPAGQGRGAELNPEVLARGGVSQLVADLNRLFIFGEEQTLRRGERTVRAVLGRWRPAELERQWPELSTSGVDNWPEHLPHHVLVYIDNGDFFPYLVEYRGGDQASLAESAAAHFPAPDPLASFEFIDVQFANPIPSELFQFTPNESDWHDETGSIVERLKPAPPKEEEPATARRNGAWR